jgi:hypothetical protein
MLKVSEGRPNGVDRIINGEIALVINTPLGTGARSATSTCCGQGRPLSPTACRC